MESRKNTDTVSLHQFGDRELWYAEGAEWSLPMYIDWKHDRDNDRHYGLVIPACNLYQNQSIMMNALMVSHDVARDKTKWIIPRRIAETILKKAPGITPACYYKWPDAACPPLPPSWSISKFKHEEEPQQSWENQSFVAHLSKVRKIPSSVVKMVLTAVGEEAPKWMLINRKPLELGFCRLIAAPFRSNWKEVVAAKCGIFKMLGIFNMRAEEMWPALDAIDMPGTLTSTDNIGMVTLVGRESYRIGYTLEAVATKSFEQAAHEVETERISAGSTAYVSSFEETIESLYKFLVQALATYMRKAAQPFARVSSGSHAGILSLLPVSYRKSKVCGVDARDLPIHIIPPTNPFSVLRTKGDPRIIRAQIEALRKMSSLPPEVKDLRRSKKYRELGGPEPGQEPVGMPLLDAGESEDTRPAMLPLIADTQRRMD